MGKNLKNPGCSSGWAQRIEPEKIYGTLSNLLYVGNNGTTTYSYFPY